MKTYDNVISAACTWGLAIFVSVALTTNSAFSQCEFGWKPGEGIPGVNGSVYAVTTWDPDANGPQPEVLVVGGCFSVAGDVMANNIAIWNGNNWQPLGSGIGITGTCGGGGGIFALTVYNGELIAGGAFSTAGGVSTLRIARWNGSIWQSLGSGMTDSVQALTVYSGELIAGGYFYSAGGVPSNRIARWNGSNWQPLGNGVSSNVSALMVYNSQLIAGGYFHAAGDVSSDHIAQWDGGIWQSIGSGMAGGYHAGVNVDPSVRSLTVYNQELIAGGCFARVGDVDANNIARWNGSTWQMLGSGIDVISTNPNLWL